MDLTVSRLAPTAGVAGCHASDTCLPSPVWWQADGEAVEPVINSAGDHLIGWDLTGDGGRWRLRLGHETATRVTLFDAHGGAEVRILEPDGTVRIEAHPWAARAALEPLW